MKWDMEIEEIEAVLEKIWDLHDKLSDAIHSISRTHFLNSIKTPSPPLKTTSAAKKKNLQNDAVEPGFVFVKDFRLDDTTTNNNVASAVEEAKSLNAIRTALENLEDQLEFFHTVQMQQRAERDAAIARLEQSRIILAMRLAEHHGKKYKVIEEALAFVSDVHDATHFVSPENLFGSPPSPAKEDLVRQDKKRPNMLINVFISTIDFAKRSLKLDNVGGIFGNAALFAVSMIALLQLHQASYKQLPYKQEEIIYGNRNARKTSQLERPSSSGGLKHLDVMLAKG